MNEDRLDELKPVYLAFNGYDTFKDGVLITSPDLSILYCNPSFKTLFSFSNHDEFFNGDEMLRFFVDRDLQHEDMIYVLNQVRSNLEWTGSHTIPVREGESFLLYSTPFPEPDSGLMGRIWIFKHSSQASLPDNLLVQPDSLFRTIFDLIPEGIAISDLTTGRFYEVNEHFSKWWGFSREEVIGKTAIDLDFWVDINQRNDVIDRLRQYGYFHLIPVKMRGKDKKIKDILFSGRTITIDDKPYMISIPVDVTNLRQYEEKILSLASFIELNPNPVLEIDVFGNIIMNNEAAGNILFNLTGNYDLSQYLPEQLDEILDAIDNEVEKSFVLEIAIQDRIFLEYVYVTNQSHTARIYLTDITDRKKIENELLRKNEELGSAYEEIISTEEELRQNYDKLIEQERKLNENERKLRMIVDHIPGIVLTTDTTMRLKSIFGAGLEKIGLLPNEGIGKSIEEIIPHADKEMVHAHHLALKGMDSSIEAVYGDRNTLLYTSPIYDAQNTITGTIGIAIDITEQKTLEKERKNLLIQLEQNLIELAVLNDKIRNPLTVIATLVDMYAPDIEVPISQCIREIDDIISNLDKRWMESEKTINFLQKHYGIGNL